MARIVHIAGLAALSVLALIPAAMADNIQIPEPASLSIFAVAAGTLALLRRKG